MRVNSPSDDNLRCPSEIFQSGTREDIWHVTISFNTANIAYITDLHIYVASPQEIRNPSQPAAYNQPKCSHAEYILVEPLGPYGTYDLTRLQPLQLLHHGPTQIVI